MHRAHVEILQVYIKARLESIEFDGEEDSVACLTIVESVSKLPDEVYLPVFHQLIKKRYKSKIDTLGVFILRHFQQRKIPLEAGKMLKNINKEDFWNSKIIFNLLLDIKYTAMIDSLFEEDNAFKDFLSYVKYVDLVELVINKPQPYKNSLLEKIKTSLDKEKEGSVVHSVTIFDLLVRLLRVLSDKDVSYLESLYNHKSKMSLKQNSVEREIILSVDSSFQEIYVKLLEENNHREYNEYILQNLYMMQYPNMNRVYEAIEKNKYNSSRLYIKYISHKVQSNEINIMSATIEIAKFIVEAYNKNDFISVNREETKNALITYFQDKKTFHEELTLELINRATLIPKMDLESYNRLIDSYVREWGINNKTRIF